MFLSIFYRSRNAKILSRQTAARTSGARSRSNFSLLEQDGTLPFTIRQLNNLLQNVKQRVYRGLIPPALLKRLGIDPIQWTDAGKEQRVFVKAEENHEKVLVTAQSSPSAADEFFALELTDNSLNGIE